MVRKRGATAQKRDHSMLYGVLGGFGLFVLLPLLVALYFIWPSYMYSKAHPFFRRGRRSRKQMTTDFPEMEPQPLRLKLHRTHPRSLRRSCGRMDFKKRRFPILCSGSCRESQKQRPPLRLPMVCGIFKTTPPKNFGASIVGIIRLKFTTWMPAFITASNPIPEAFRVLARAVTCPGKHSFLSRV